MSDSILEKLAQIPLFAELRGKAELLKRLEGICKTRTYQKNQEVVREGEVGSEMFVVYKGSVEIRKKTRAGDSYTVLVLRDTDNVFFGELALVDDDSRSATVMASEDSEFLVISKRDFNDLANRYPELGLPITRAIARILASRLRKTTVDMLTIFDALVSEIQA